VLCLQFHSVTLAEVLLTKQSRGNTIFSLRYTLANQLSFSPLALQPSAATEKENADNDNARSCRLLSSHRLGGPFNAPRAPPQRSRPPGRRFLAAPALPAPRPEAQTSRRTSPPVPSRPRRGLTAGEQRQGHGDGRHDGGDPQDPQQPLQEGLQGEAPSGGGRARAAARPPAP